MELHVEVRVVSEEVGQAIAVDVTDAICCPNGNGGVRRGSDIMLPRTHLLQDIVGPVVDPDDQIPAAITVDVADSRKTSTPVPGG